VGMIRFVIGGRIVGEEGRYSWRFFIVVVVVLSRRSRSVFCRPVGRGKREEGRGRGGGGGLRQEREREVDRGNRQTSVGTDYRFYPEHRTHTIYSHCVIATVVFSTVSYR